MHDPIAQRIQAGNDRMLQGEFPNLEQVVAFLLQYASDSEVISFYRCVAVTIASPDLLTEALEGSDLDRNVCIVAAFKLLAKPGLFVTSAYEVYTLEQFKILVKERIFPVWKLRNKKAGCN